MAIEPRATALPFDEAIAFLRDKLRLTSRGWTDVWQEANAVAFTVAGATSAQLVADLHQIVTKLAAQGTTLAEFREDFDAVVAQHGWSHRGGRAWRTRVIFETNLRTAYQAGRWQQAWRLRDTRPYLRYVAVLDNRTRPAHREWHGTVLPITSAWWDTHYPPNDWGCRCSAQSLSERDLARRGYKLSAEPGVVRETRRISTPDGTRQVDAVQGLGTGWAYNVGQASMQARVAQAAYRDIGKMPADLGAVAGETIAATTRRAMADDFRSWVTERQAAGFVPDGTWRPLGALSPTTVAHLTAAGQAPQTAGVAITSEQLRHLTRGYKLATGKALDMADILKLPEILDQPDAVLREKASGLLLMVFTPVNAPDAKLVVELDYARRLRNAAGERRHEVFNAVISGGIVPVQQLRDRAAYELIEGSV